MEPIPDAPCLFTRVTHLTQKYNPCSQADEHWSCPPSCHTGRAGSAAGAISRLADDLGWQGGRQGLWLLCCPCACLGRSEGGCNISVCFQLWSGRRLGPVQKWLMLAVSRSMRCNMETGGDEVGASVLKHSLCTVIILSGLWPQLM